jgi:hypothetical protein
MKLSRETNSRLILGRRKSNVTFENPSQESQNLELTELLKSLQALILAQTETIKTQNLTIQNQNQQIQGMQTQLMTLVNYQSVSEQTPDDEDDYLVEEELTLDAILFLDQASLGDQIGTDSNI